MKYKKILMILMLAIFIFGVASVCASDVNDTVMACTDDSAIELSQADAGENELISQTDNELIIEGNGGTFAELQANITAASEGSTLTLNKDYECEDGFDIEGILIDKPLTIDGNGSKIDAQGKSRIFKITAENVILKNIIFTNGKTTEHGGAVYFEKSSNVTNCNFVNNTAAENGGAIYFKNDGNIINCSLTENSANNGGAIWIYSGNVVNCNFTNNTISNGGGGAVYMYLGNVTNCDFNNNMASNGEGGAVYFVWSNCNLMNCNFNNNSAKYTGGAVYLNSGSFGYCNFVNNSAGNYGGAVHCYDTCNITFCNFMDNYADYGSAFYFVIGGSSKIFSNTCFLNNKAKVDEKSAFNVIKNGTNIQIAFLGHDNHLNAIYSNGKVICTNVTYWGAEGISNTGSSQFISIRLDNEAGQNITVEGVVDGRIINTTEVTDKNGMVVLKDVGDYWIIVGHDDDSYYTKADETLFTNMGLYANVTSIATNNKTVNITAKSNIYNEIMPGKLLFILPNSTEIDATYDGNGTWWAQHTFDEYGEFKVNALYIGLNNVTVNNATIIIDKADSTITLDNITLDYGESKNVTVETEGAIGITANINGTNVTVINNYTIPISDLGAGNYILTVTTIPDGDHNPVTATSKITVNKVNSTLTVENIIFDYGSEGSGDVSFTGASEITANVINQPKAIVNINNNKITVSGLAAGTYVLNVTIVPDENHTAVTQTAAITVNKAHTEIILGNDSFDMEAIDYVVLNDTLNPAGAGNLTYTSSDENIVRVENGLIMADAAGTAIVTVSFAGNENYTAAENKTIKVNVRLNNASVSVKNTTLDLNIGDEFDLNATQNPWFLDIQYTSNNESVVTVNDEGIVTAVGEGTATITLTVGNNITYVINSTNVTVNVKKIDTIIDVDEKSLDLKVGDETAVIATLTPVDAGNITFTSSNSSVVFVDAKGNVVADGKGQAIITVSFAGNDKYAAAENKTITVNVSLDDASVTVDNDTLDLMVGETYTINATKYPDTILLDITYTSSDDSVATVDKNGVVTAVGEGTAIITVEVGDDEIYAKNSTTVTVNVKDNAINVFAPNVTKYFNGTERFVVSVTDSRNNPLANQSVIINVAGVNYTRTTNTNGTASIAINLISGQYNVTTIVNNNTVYSTITVLPTVNATDLVKVFRNGTQFYATFKDSNGNYLADGTMVRFNINGVMYDRKVSGNNGLAKLNINLEQGQYVITSMNLKTSENAANNVTVISRLIENKDITKYYRNATQYTVKVIDDTGKATGAGETVTFNINGVFYNRTTNESGIAKLNINLHPGDYVITAEYKNCRVSNNIKVLPVLTAKDLTKKYGTPDQFVAKLLDGTGKALSGETIQFNINGVFYNRVTDSNGQAKLNIRLMSGKYIITSSYNGTSIANTITVTA